MISVDVVFVVDELMVCFLLKNELTTFRIHFAVPALVSITNQSQMSQCKVLIIFVIAKFKLLLCVVSPTLCIYCVELDFINNCKKP